MSSEIGVRLTGDNADFRSMLDQSAEDAGKFGGKITSKLADKVLGLKDVSTAVATALGLNLENISQNIARVFSRMSKESEEAFKKLSDVSSQAADASIKNMRATLTEEQRYQLALQERDRLQKQIDVGATAGAKYQLALKEKEIQLAEKVAQIQAYVSAQAEKADEERRKAFEEEVKAREAINEKQRKGQMEKMSMDEREKLIREEIRAIEFLMAQTSTTANEQQRFRNTLVQREAELVDVIAKGRDKHVAALERKAELTFAALPIEEKILTYQESIAQAEYLITTAKMLGLNHDEEDVIVLENKAALAKLIAEQAGKQTVAAADNTDFLRRQSEIQEILGKGVGALTEEDKSRLTVLAGQNGVLQQQIEIVGALTEQFTNFKIGITRTGADYDTQSTTALEGTLSRLRSRLNPNGNLPGASSSTNNDIFGGYLNNAAIKPEIRAIEAELARRREVGSYASRYGEDATRFRYGDADTDKALRDMQESTTRSATALEQISNQLSASGIFPRNSPSR
jgi:hypothetical protein